MNAKKDHSKNEVSGSERPKVFTRERRPHMRRFGKTCKHFERMLEASFDHSSKSYIRLQNSVLDTERIYQRKNPNGTWHA